MTKPIDRRQFLSRSLILGGGALAGSALELGPLSRPAFALIRSGAPQVANGVQAGDVDARSAVIWSRADRPARMTVEWATDERFSHARQQPGPFVDAASDHTGRVTLHGLPPGADVFYRVRFSDPHHDRTAGEAAVGHLRTAPSDGRAVSFLWSGDTAGQGWGINPDIGGMRIYETMRQTHADFFVHSGDGIYADGPIPASKPLANGGVWNNITTPEKAKVAETLDEFRGNWRYNLLDDNLRRFYAEVPLVAQWDDHEVVNNWYPGEILDYRPEYTEKRVDVLSARAARAFHEYTPITIVPNEPNRVYRQISYGPSLDVFVLDMRTYRGPNSPDDQSAPGPPTAFLGARQLDWLKRSLRRSKATWKVIAADMPLALVVPDNVGIEAVAQGDPRLLGREFEFADLLSFAKREGVRNMVWITADVHYTAAHHYDPARGTFTDFDPFWEFVSGPLNAGTFGPNSLDPTFGPEVRFQKAADYPNQPPSDGNQFFGHVAIDGISRVMTVRLQDLAGKVLWSTAIVPR